MASAPSFTVRTRPLNSPRDSISVVRSRSAGLSSTSRISVLVFMALLLPEAWCCRESEFESRTTTLLRCDPYSSAILLDDLAADGQADSVAGILGAGVQPLKYDKDILAILRRNADAVVGNGEFPFVLLPLSGDLNLRSFWPAKFNGIADQVLKYLRDLRGIRQDNRQVIVGDLCLTLADRDLKIGNGALSLIAQPLFLKGAQHCHGQARQPVFENIIHSALLDAFDRADVAESSGDQNQRDVQLFIAQNVQRFQSPPLGEVVVGEHYLVRVGSHSRGKFLFCFDNIHGEIEPATPQLTRDEFNVR